MKMMKKMKNSGFTLMELMIVIAIIAIMAGVAIPNFLGWLPEKRLAAGAQDILQGLQKSRSKAIMTNRRVVVNFDAAANSFTAFVDENADGAL
ncbi:MAG: GspH/FimT family pseudopilin, partial [Thermodesulfobacteriota bacterium]